jgi:hypothetical protein
VKDYCFILRELDEAPLTLAELRVYIHLVRRSNWKTHQCFPGIDSIAKACVVTTRTVMSATAKLKALRMIAFDPARGRGKTNLYTILPASQWVKKVKTETPFIEQEKVKPEAGKGEIGDIEKPLKGEIGDILKGEARDNESYSSEVTPEKKEEVTPINNPAVVFLTDKKSSENRTSEATQPSAPSPVAPPLISPTENTLDSHKCKCGGHAVLRQRRDDSRIFIGCSNLGKKCTTFCPADGDKGFAEFLRMTWEAGPGFATQWAREFGGMDKLTRLFAAMPEAAKETLVDKFSEEESNAG